MINGYILLDGRNSPALTSPRVAKRLNFAPQQQPTLTNPFSTNQLSCSQTYRDDRNLDPNEMTWGLRFLVDWAYIKLGF